MNSFQYYYARWKSHCLRLIITLGLLANACVFAILAALYGRGDIVIWLGVAAAFLLFVAVIENRHVTRYYQLTVRARGYYYDPNQPTK